MFLEISQNSQENTYVMVSLCQGLKPTPLLKRDSGTVVFLGILRNFKKHLFKEHLRETASV